MKETVKLKTVVKSRETENSKKLGKVIQIKDAESMRKVKKTNKTKKVLCPKYKENLGIIDEVNHIVHFEKGVPYETP